MSEQHPAAYREDWLCDLYRWLGSKVELAARRVRYPKNRRGVRYLVLDPLADRLTWAAVQRGWRLSK